MPQKDYIGPSIKIKQSMITFDLDDLYKMLNTWFTDRGYDILEKEHKEYVDSKGIKHTKFALEVDKKVDDYTKLQIEIDLEAKTKEVAVEKSGEKTAAQKGGVELEFKGCLLKDIEEEWRIREKGAIGKFLREFYDRFAMRDKLESYNKKLNDDLKEVINDVKTFLRLKRYE